MQNNAPFPTLRQKYYVQKEFLLPTGGNWAYGRKYETVTLKYEYVPELPAKQRPTKPSSRDMAATADAYLKRKRKAVKRLSLIKK